MPLAKSICATGVEPASRASASVGSRSGNASLTKVGTMSPMVAVELAVRLPGGEPLGVCDAEAQRERLAVTEPERVLVAVGEGEGDGEAEAVL